MSNGKRTGRRTKVCHMTDIHQQEDIRIFHKESTSLAENGYEVYQVSRGQTYESKGVHMAGIGEVAGNRLLRMTRAARKVYETSRKIDADIYHFHDPELLPYGLKLKKQGKKVIFDSHEDVPAQIMDKDWIPKPLRKIVSVLYRLYETYAVRHFDAVVAATPYIAKQFKGRAKKVVIVNNYPKLDDIRFHDTSFRERERIICYAGGISDIRGENIMTEAMKDVDGTLILAGEHPVQEMRVGNSAVIKYIGKRSRDEVNELYGKSVVGLSILMPAGNHINAQPNKIYEYMAAGLPFICSAYPLWEKISKDTKAGICVDPYDIKSLGKAINEILEHTDKAEEMGKCGRMAVEKYYNWGREKEKLISLYDTL